jgi:putative transposase
VRKSRFKEEQIIGILQEFEAGVPTAELCRKHGIAAVALHYAGAADGERLYRKLQRQVPR